MINETKCKKTKVLFLYPNFPMSHLLLPAGVSILATVLKQENFDVKLFDTTLYAQEDDLFDDIRISMLQLKSANTDEYSPSKTSDPHVDFEALLDSFEPDLLAASILQDTFPIALEYMKIAHDRGIKVIAGGIYPTFCSDEVINESCVDIVCVGEGENALLNVCRALEDGTSFDNIPNLIVKTEDNGVIRNPLGPLVNVNELPNPDYSIFDEERFFRPMQGNVLRMLPIELHRGCPYKCAFCEDPSQNLLYKNAGVAKTYHRSKSPKRVIEELHHIVDNYGANYIYFNAETFFAMPNSDFLELADLYEKEIGLPFWLQTRPETITEQRVSILKKMNVSNINVGLEHGNEKYRCDVIKRCMTNDKIISGLQILADADIPVTVNNIMGFPDETRELVFDTIELNRKIKTATINAYLYNPYKGTGLYDVCRDKGYIQESDDEKMIDLALSTKAFAYFKTCLKMPTISGPELLGLQKTFVLYSKLPRVEFPRIKIAEQNNEEGDQMFNCLFDEFEDVLAGRRTIEPEVLEFMEA